MTRQAQPKFRLKPTGRRSGLALIELLVVIGILTLLAAILLPAVFAARQQARRLGCAAHLRAVGHALNLYKTELGRYPVMGDRNPNIFPPSWPPGDPRRYRSVTHLDNIIDLAEALLKSSLGNQEALYCPISLLTDPHAPRPDLHNVGHISYIYLAGLNYADPATTFPDANGQPTYIPEREAPDRRVNRANPRTVLIGDRAVDIVPPYRLLPGDNHQREGGWFFFTTGDAQWWARDRLTAHPTPVYVWYWPRMSRPAVN